MGSNTQPTCDAHSTVTELKPTRSGPKRALPTRHSFLTEAIQYALEKQSIPWQPTINAETVLVITNAAELADCVEKPVDTAMDDIVDPRKDLPGFVICNPSSRQNRRSLKDAGADSQRKVEMLSEDYYHKRHRKHEVEEKKQKNREKEKLMHEMHKQQQFVERVRHTDKSIIAAIAKSLCQDEKDTVIDSDALYRDILHDAEELLERYVMLGLGRRPRHSSQPKQDTVTSPISHAQSSAVSSIKASPSPSVEPELPVHQAQSPAPSSSSAASAPVRPRSPAQTLASPPSSQTKTSPSSSSSTKPPFTTFKTSLEHPRREGVRRSSRNILAFGRKIPPMKEREFQLPIEQFGSMMDARIANAKKQRASTAGTSAKPSKKRSRKASRQ